MKRSTKILLALVAGAVAGCIANAVAGGSPWLLWLASDVASPVGQVFLRMLLMTVVPLVFTSVALGVAGIGDVRRLGKIGGRTLVYFLLTTALAAAIGLTLVELVRPGDGIDPATRDELYATYRGQAEGLQTAPSSSFGLQTLVDVIPRNAISAMASADMLGVIVFALVFGTALTLVPAERGRATLRGLESLGDVVMRMIDLAMALAPIGVFALVFAVTARFGWHLLGQLGLYVAVVLGGLLLHAGVCLSVLVWTLGRTHPLVFWRAARASLVTAFSTSSSSATLPTNLAVAERQLGVPPAVAGFVLPLGATMNMNGTALYEGVTVLFLAQVFGVELTLAQQAVVLALSVVTAVGAAGVPGGSLPLMMVVLGTVGVPPEGIAVILGVDRLLDMCRTTVNVAGDLTAALYVARFAPVVEGEEVLPAIARVIDAGEPVG